MTRHRLSQRTTASVVRLRSSLNVHRRTVAAGAAIAINVLLVGVFSARQGLGGAPEAEERLQVAFVIAHRPPPVQRAVAPEPSSRPHRELRSHAHQVNDALVTRGPPTETVAREFPPGEQLKVTEIADSAELIHLCRNANPTATSTIQDDVTVSLRVYVMADGRIGQGRIEHTSGDVEFDRIVFGCVQTYANLEPAVVEGSPVGSWQTVTARLSRR